MVGGIGYSSCSNLQFPVNSFRLDGFAFGCVKSNLNRSRRAASTILTGPPDFRYSYLRCCSFQAMAYLDNSFPFEWVPIIDQMLPLASASFGYLTNVFSSSQPFAKHWRDYQNEPEISSSFGGSLRQCITNSEDIWDRVKGKLVDVMQISYEHVLYDAQFHDECRRMHPLSLYAISAGPRFRLLWAIAQQLYEEVKSIPSTHEAADRNGRMVILAEVLHRSLLSGHSSWLELELYSGVRAQDKALAYLCTILEEDTTSMRHIKSLGKEDLYADFIFFVRFGADSSCFLHGSKLVKEHAVDILEDMAIMLADGIASIYLKLVALDGDLTIEGHSLNLGLISLSTRELQKLRNEILLNWWLHDNIKSVMSLYEDRFDLLVLRTELIDDPVRCQKEKGCWLKKFFGKSATGSSLFCDVSIIQLTVAVKRTTELRNLTGWRYCFCLWLEFMDIIIPLARAITVKAGDAVSFLVACLVGQVFGQIHAAIKQALVWR